MLFKKLRSWYQCIRLKRLKKGAKNDQIKEKVIDY